MVAFYTATKDEHPFGEERYRLDNLLNGNPVGLDTLEDPVLKDLLSWMLRHNPKDRPSAEEALKHPYLQPVKQQFEMLCKMGNQQEITANLGQAFLFQVPYLIAIFLFTFAILKKFVANLLRNIANLLSQLKTPHFLLEVPHFLL